MIAQVLVAKTQIAAIFGACRVADFGFFNVDFFKRVRTTAHVVVLIAEFVFELNAQVVAIDERARFARQIERIAASRVKSTVAFVAFDFFSTTMIVAKVGRDRFERHRKH